MNTINIANAPCSWGALEFELEGKAMEYPQVLDEMVETEYSGTELGDWGFMPTNPDLLKNELQKRNLELLGAFVPVAFKYKEKHHDGLKRALKTATLMKNAGFDNAFIILADDNGTEDIRTQNAGRITPGMMLKDDQWKTFASGVEMIASTIQQKLGMRTIFHHHCGGYVETPAEIEKLMDLTCSGLLGLCLDTGHYMFGGGDPMDALEKYGERVWHVHFKDFDQKVLQQSKLKQFNYFESVANGIFCELGKGVVDFEAFSDQLKAKNYNGWIVVEQDVLPGMGEPLLCAAKNRKYLKSLNL